MIPMNCPKCGAGGEVPMDRLDSKLTCRKCGTAFFVDMYGKVFLWDPKKKDKPKQVEEKYEPIEINLNPVDLYKKVPKWAKMIVAVAAGLTLVVAGVVWAANQLSEPSDPEYMANKVAGFWVDKKLDEIKALATEDGLKELDEWYNSVRPKFKFEGPRANPEEVYISSLMMGLGKNYAETATTLAVADLAGGSSTGGKNADAEGKRLDLKLMWTKQDGRWKVDGKATLGDYKNADARKKQLRGRTPKGARA